MHSIYSLICYLQAPNDSAHERKKETCVEEGEECGVAVLTVEDQKFEYWGCLSNLSCSPIYVSCLSFCNTDLCVPDTTNLKNMLKSRTGGRKASAVLSVFSINFGVLLGLYY